MNQTIKELVRLNIKPNFAALGREYGCDYRTAKIRYYEELNKEKGIEPEFKIALTSQDVKTQNVSFRSQQRTNKRVVSKIRK